MLHKGKAQLQASFPVRRQVLFMKDVDLICVQTIFIAFIKKHIIINLPYKAYILNKTPKAGNGINFFGSGLLG